MMVALTPAELQTVAKKCREEADEIQKGPISHFACDAVFDLNSQAERHERDANELDVAIAEHAEATGDIETLEAQVEVAKKAMRESEKAWWKAFDAKDDEKERAAYNGARKAYCAAVAALLIATGKVTK